MNMDEASLAIITGPCRGGSDTHRYRFTCMKILDVLKILLDVGGGRPVEDFM